MKIGPDTDYLGDPAMISKHDEWGNYFTSFGEGAFVTVDRLSEPWRMPGWAAIPAGKVLITLSAGAPLRYVEEDDMDNYRSYLVPRAGRAWRRARRHVRLLAHATPGRVAKIQHFEWRLAFEHADLSWFAKESCVIPPCEANLPTYPPYPQTLVALMRAKMEVNKRRTWKDGRHVKAPLPDDL